MKKILQFIIIIFLYVTIANCQTTRKPESDLTGSYLGQHPPGRIPKIFAPGFVSTDVGELNTIVSPDGNEIYFCRSQPSSPTKIMVTRNINDRWTSPQVASFCSSFSDMDPSMSANGLTIFFGSTRPNGKPNARGCDIWRVERSSVEEGWSEPVNLAKPINTLENENFPTATHEGTLYFQSKGHGGLGRLDIFRSTISKGKYSTPENLGKAINSVNNDFDAFIARDESYLIFSSYGRSDGFGSGDLYISFRKKDGSWTKAINMGAPINSDFMEYCPMITPDGKYFFFTSGRTGEGDIYWMDASVIQEMKPKSLK